MARQHAAFAFDRSVSAKFRTYLGSNKGTLEYDQKMFSSADRFDSYSIPGLYAIVVPSGGGKSTLCRRWGFIDVDDVIGDREVMEKLVLHRRELIRWGRDDWEEHNQTWYAMVRSVLKRYNFNEKPNVIMVHTEEMAYEIGAYLLGALVPGKNLEKERLRDRNHLERMLAVDNLHIVEKRTKTVPVDVYNSWAQLDQFVAFFCWHEVTLAAPFRGFSSTPKNGWPIGYSSDVPLWVMQGDLKHEDACTIVQKLFEEGAVPGVCHNYFLQRNFTIRDSSTDSPWDCSSWIDMCCKVSQAGVMKPVSDGVIEISDLNYVFPYQSKMAQNKRTVGLRRLLENIDISKNVEMMKVLKARGGSNQNLVVAIVVWMCGVLADMRPEIQEAVFDSGVLMVPDESWIYVMKRVHDMVRTTSCYFGVMLNRAEQQRLMYMHMMYGRFTYQVEEEEEIHKRERDLDGKKLAYVDGAWSADEYDRLELAGIRDAYKRLCDSVPSYRILDFVEFWKLRREWAAKGSTVIFEGEKKYMIGITDSVVKKIEQRHNKKSLFEDEAECQKVLAEIINNVGRNDSKIVPKFESAAKRALLPGNLYHYVVFSYVLWTFENCASVGDVRLGNKRDESFHAFDDKLFTNLTRFAYDFSDFNAQHSRRSMARVMSLLSECTDPVDTLKFCLKWLSVSFGEMELIDSKGVKHPVKSGLYSGWRGTTWINSVLNHTYMYVARVCYHRLFSTDPFVQYEGAGDDVDGVVRDSVVAGRLYRITVEMGLESNTLKQLFGNRAEFLRVTYDKGYAGASVCRGLGNFISGNWEGEGGSIQERIASAIENVITLGRRGLSEMMVKVLYRCILGHMGRIFDGQEWLPISDHVLHGRVEDNGFGIPDKDGCLWKLERPAPAPEGWSGYLKLPSKSASSDWASIIEAEVKERGMCILEHGRLIDALAKDSYDIDSIAARFGTEISPEAWKKYWSYRCGVVEKINIETNEINEGLMYEFFEWLGSEESPMLDKIERLDRVGEYIQYVGTTEGGSVGQKEWYGELYEAKLRLDNFDAQRWAIVKCPPIVQSKAARWCREMIACDILPAVVARHMYMLVCNTYGEIFNMEV